MGAKITQHGLIVAFFLTLLLPPVASAAVGPPDCLAYAYTKSDEHFFLVQNGSRVYGNDIHVVHDCQEARLYVDGEFQAGSQGSFTSPLTSGVLNITIETTNATFTYNSVEVRPDRLDWDFNFSLAYPDQAETVPLAEALEMQNWAAAFTGLIVWVLCVYVYWNLVDSFVQRNFVEEVVA